MNKTNRNYQQHVVVQKWKLHENPVKYEIHIQNKPKIATTAVACECCLDSPAHIRSRSLATAQLTRAAVAEAEQTVAWTQHMSTNHRSQPWSTVYR